MMKKRLTNIFIIITIVFCVANLTLANTIKISDDINIPYNKDYNCDGKIVVTLDPGHGGTETGTTRRKYFFDDKDLVKEKDVNLYIAKKVKEYITNNSNIQVYMTRDEDKKVSLTNRGAIAGKNKSDLMVSLHVNSLDKMNNSSTTMGTEIWQSVIDIYKPIGLPKSLFTELNKNHFLQVIRGTRERASTKSFWNYEKNDSQSKNNGNPADYYGVIKAGCKNRVPTIILEHSFLTNEADFANILDYNYLNELAERIGRGIINYYK